MEIPVLLDQTGNPKRAFILHHPLAVYDESDHRSEEFARVFVELKEDGFLIRKNQYF